MDTDSTSLTHMSQEDEQLISQSFELIAMALEQLSELQSSKE